ncbi:putative quinol monooxygenase [Methylovirgula sp. 4M-Z18]|uniref:putative quinol monooxygenase n=1 Tax=Methylovirgula sp. 4M-Z18 TaxID=2293567 RepID=UPI000E2F5A73|nr:putative quinol monooxygenase [Methylovirgula sp. 4M-Z18]RFB79196.1 antibiotic biosynthesis monooxygenase [Methylovirgula sp. 4M-Z18]
MLFIIATLKCQVAKRDALIAAARTCIGATRQEPGCGLYDMHESVTEPGTFRFVEHWQDRAAVDAHLSSPHIKAFSAVAAECLAEAPRIELITPAGVEFL